MLNVGREVESVQVKYRCGCVADTAKMTSLQIRCPQHHDNITDWSSEYRSPYRAVIHWQEGRAGFALHKVEYDEHGFVTALSRESITPIYQTTADLSHEARRLGMSMDEVSDIFYDRYLEYQEFFPETRPQ